MEFHPSHGSVFRSQDHGVTWVEVYNNSGTTGETITDLTADPDDPELITILDADFQLIQSTDGGDNWTVLTTLPSAASPLASPALAYNFSVLAGDPISSGCMYLGAEGPHVFASCNNGRSWLEITNWTGGSAPSVASLAINSADTRTIFAGVNGTGTQGVWKREYSPPDQRVFIPLVKK